MKKRVLMMMLAGVLAFSMIGCGGGDQQETSGSEEQIVDVEDGENEEGTGEEEEGQDEKDGQ